MPADFTEGRQYIILTGFIQEEKNLLYFSWPKEIACPTMNAQGFILCIVTWISQLGYFGEEPLMHLLAARNLIGENKMSQTRVLE